MANFFHRLKTDRQFLYLVLIITLALSLRLIRVTFADSYTDEVLYSFRAIGLIDYDTSPTQTTPWQWFNEVPWWGHLSFHDHPPFFFFLQHIFMKLLGINLFTIRLPVVLAGIGSVILIYLIVRRLFSQMTALLSALLLSINPYHIWISRIGLQDGVVIFLLLLILWLWLKAEEDKKYLLWCGTAIGIGLLTKYTILIILPILILHAFIFRKVFFRSKEFWLGILLIIAVSSPVWLYNIFLYKARGHFDFQISAFLGQNVPEWAFRMGRAQAGGLIDRIKNFFVSLHLGQAVWFNGGIALSSIFLLATWIKNKKREYSFLLGSTVLMFLWFLIIGAALRFVVMIIPFLIIIFSITLIYFYSRSRRFSFILILTFVLAMILFSANSFLLSKPYGISDLAYASVNRETQNYGFNQLDDYLGRLLKNKYSLFIGEPEYNFLKKLPEVNIAKMKDRGLEPMPVFIIFENGLNPLADLWVFDRRLYYDGWLIINEDLFERTTGERLDNYYRELGVEKFIYIRAAGNQVRATGAVLNNETGLKRLVDNLSLEPKVIKNASGEEAFLVYEF